MSYEDIMERTLGEMVDMINLLAVYSGSATERKKYTFDEIINLR